MPAVGTVLPWGAPVPDRRVAGALRALAGRDLTLMAQAPGICFMVVQTGRGTGYCGDYFFAQ
jgi:hypothetical protein